MARRKDLTALAALGTLGYMLSKKGDKASDKKDEKPTTAAAERRPAADKVDSESPVISAETIKRNTSGMDVQDEFGMVNKRLKRNPDTGELYDTEVTAPSKKPAASPAKPTVPKKVTASSLGNDDYSPSTPKASTSPSLGNDDYSPSTPKASKLSAATAAKPASSSRVPTSEQAAANRSAAMDKIKGVGSSIGDYFGNLTSTSRYMKKKPEGEYRHGGKVKKMASGGMTSSASKRADGIATKGKTRGKMY
jgi:hypothetical protein